MPATPTTWFVALPPTVPGFLNTARLPQNQSQPINYPSGAPLLRGMWAAGEVMTARTRRVVLAVVGTTDLTQGSLDSAATSLRSVDDIDSFVHRLRGSAHVIAWDGDTLRIQGTAGGLRRVYLAQIDGVPVAGDSARIVASAAGAEVSIEAVTTRLLSPLPYPVNELSMWTGVEAVPPGSYLSVKGDRATIRTWWAPPSARTSIEVGASVLQDAVYDAVALRARSGRRISCELSGGLDSTSILFLASLTNSSPDAVSAHTAIPHDPICDDPEWARRAATYLPAVEHDELQPSDFPYLFDDIDIASTLPLDEPSFTVVSNAKVRALARRAVDKGAYEHFTGHGGDFVFTSVPTYYHQTVLHQPRRTARALHGFAALYGWSRVKMLGQLLDRRTYRQWFADIVDLGTSDDRQTPPLAWGARPEVASWITDAGTELVRDVLRTHSTNVSPLSNSRGTHVELNSLRDGTRQFAAISACYLTSGVTPHAPLFDDKVVEAAIAITPTERITPWQYKPLLTASMRGIVPDSLLSRTTKSEGSSDIFLGLKSNLTDLTDLWEDSRLARHGLVDADVLRQICAQPPQSNFDDGALMEVVASEVWLRSIESEQIGEMSETG